MNLIKIGIIGCADIALRQIIPAILNLKNKYIISGIASRTEAKAYKFSSKFNIPYYIGYQNLINKENLDAVYIPLPNSMHFEWVEKSLLKGLHVLVEKSMACNFKDVKYLNDLAKKKNLILIENFQFRFHRQIDTIKRLINDQCIGDLRCLKSYFGFPPFKDKSNIRYKNKLGGGSLLDAGVYPIKISQVFLGLNVHISSSNLHIDKKRNIDIWGGAYIQQITGQKFGIISFGFDNYYQCSIELWGSKGKISANKIFTSHPTEEAKVLIENVKGEQVLTIKPDNHFENILKYFFSLIFKNNSSAREYMQNINQAKLIEELRKKAKIN